MLTSADLLAKRMMGGTGADMEEGGSEKDVECGRGKK